VFVKLYAVVCCRQVVFGRQSCSHLMLFTTDDKLYSWNLINFAGLLFLRLNAVYDYHSFNSCFPRESGLAIFPIGFLPEENVWR